MSSSVKRIRPVTTETKLERHVKRRFGMSLSDLIRKKAEVEGFYDHEIAAVLGVSSACIGKYRGKYGIRRGNRFPKGFEETHGKDAVQRFKKIIEDPDSSLVDVARHFGFTREYARQLYQRIYGFPYTDTLKRKRELRDRRRLKQKLRKLTKIAERMESRGIDFEVEDRKRKLLVLRNGQRITVKICSRPYGKGQNRYFRFVPQPFPTDVNFFVCVCRHRKNDVYFIIPSNEMPERLSIPLTLDATPDQSKYTKFREAWHLLEVG